MTRPLRRALALLCFVAALLLTALPYAAAHPPLSPAPAPSSTSVTTAAVERAPVVFVGTGGFTWADVSPEATPNLWHLLEVGASATVSVRSVNPNTCPIDGWLALSAGQRAAAPTGTGRSLRSSYDGCPPIPASPAAGRPIPGWDDYVAAADEVRFDAILGTLGDTLAAAGRRTVAIGDGAALALSDGSGRVGTAYPGLGDEPVPTEVAAAVAGSRVAVVDLGAVRDPGDLGTGEVAPTATGAQQLATLDRRLGTVLQALPAGADVIVAGLSDGGRATRLRPVVAAGPSFPAGELYSSSTRQPGLVQSSDLHTTLVDLVGGEPLPGLGGAVLETRREGPATAAGATERRRHLVDLDAASHEIHTLVPPFFYGLVIAQLVIYLIVWRLWSKKVSTASARVTMMTWVRRIAVAASAVPAASFLANLFPWWRSEHPLPAIIGAVALPVAIIAGLALAPPSGRRLLGPVAVVGSATMVVLAADVLTGSRLQMSSLMGLQPVVGGRFYGMGNVTFSLFATATLMLAIALAHTLIRAYGRWVAAAAVVALGLLATAIDGSPAWGADGGGPPAFLPGLVYLTLAILGLRMTWRRAAVTGLVTAGLFLLVAFLDSLRAPASQSHLGRFWDTLLAGGGMDIVIRKAEQNFGILISSTLSLLVPFALIFVIYVLARPTSWGSRALQRSFENVPTLRPGLIAWLIVMTIGFFINDSGVAIPAVGATVAIPLVIAIATTTLLNEARRDPALPG